MSKILFLVLCTLVFAAVFGDVPSDISDIFEYMCTTCSVDTDCQNITNSTTINSTCDTSRNVCTINECSSASDCSTNEICKTVQCCDANLEFYNDTESSICVADDICVTITAQTDTCFSGSDGEVYTSEEEALLCGGTDGNGVCLEDGSALCTDEEDDSSEDGWVELLTDDWLYYSIAVIALLVCLCICCVCLIHRKRKSRNVNRSFHAYDGNNNNGGVYV